MTAAKDPTCEGCCNGAEWSSHHFVRLLLPRNLAVADRLEHVRFFIRDRDAKYSGRFDDVLRSEGARIMPSPVPHIATLKPEAHQGAIG